MQEYSQREIITSELKTCVLGQTATTEARVVHVAGLTQERSLLSKAIGIVHGLRVGYLKQCLLSNYPCS